MKTPKTKDGKDLEVSIYSPYEPIYDFVKNEKTGVLEVQQVGIRDIDQEITSQQDNCGMQYVLASLARGDASVLGSSGEFGDFTKAPENIGGVLALQEQAKISYQSLPDNIKQGRSMEDVINISKDDLSKLINEAVAAKMAEAAAIKEAPTNE